MNNRDRILAICNRHNLIPQATVELAEEIITIIKEDGGRSNLRPFQQKEVDDLVESFKEPKLIQGYTAENWQGIIDGGYLCEFSLVPFDTPGHVRLGKLELFTDFGFRQKEHSGISPWDFCRPAQIKGAMRPIFVEPVDPDVVVVYFDGSGQVISGSRRWMESEIPRTLATKYIEL